MPEPVVNAHQPSMTEWFAAIGEIEESNAFREEDNRKVDRLETLYQTIGLPYERPESFEAVDAFTPSEAFQKLLETRGHELCAFRLTPKRADLPKMRQRGLSIRACYDTWLLKQEIDPKEYTLYVCPHCDALEWSMIFVIQPGGLFGEIVRGLHSQLTQGETKSEVYRFQYDFSNWQWSAPDEEARRQLERALSCVQVSDQGIQRHLAEIMQSTFTQDLLQGYFEATVWPDGRVYVIDYNRILPSFFSPPPTSTPSSFAGALLRGAVAYTGRARGRVRLVNMDQAEIFPFDEGDILVTQNTDVRFLPYMRRAGAIVTNLGGILSHAAIVARELKKPCIIGTKNATTVLKDGDYVEVDAIAGTVRLFLSG